MIQVKRVLTSTLVVGLLGVVGGCALTNPTDPYAPVRIFQGSSPRGAVSQGAGTSPKASGPVTLPQCIETALANNPLVGTRFWEVEAAKAQQQVAESHLWPTLTAVGAYQKYLDRQLLVGPHAPGAPGTWSSDVFSSGLLLHMPLFTGGRLISEVVAAKLLQEAAAHRLARTRGELVFNVSSTFYSILAQREIITSVEGSRKAIQEHLRRIQDMMAVQRAAKVDLLRTEVRLADLEQRLVREKNVLAIQHRLLANLMGIPLVVETPLQVKGELVLPRAKPDEKDALKQAYANRDDYLATRAEVEAQAKNVDVARAARWPNVFLEGTYGGRWAAGETTHQPGAESSEDVGSVGVSVEVPVFEGGGLEAAIRRERARLAAAQQRLLDLQLRIRLEVQTAVLNGTSSLERVRATEKAIEQAQESLRIEQEKYTLGKGSITDVLDAQSELLQAQSNYYRALADYNTALAELHLAKGEQP